jgi:hexosaminidase
VTGSRAAEGVEDVEGLGLVPQPASVHLNADDGFTLAESTVLDADEASSGVAAWLRSALGPATGLPLRDGHGPRDANAITLRVTEPESSPGESASLAAEGYRLSVTADGVLIEGESAAGVFYGAQTLRALLPAAAYRRAPIGSATWRVPGVTISDRPRFGWRGALIDVARHFLPKQDLLRFIDLVALHKLNVLHLHLTDDQGWRIEIRRYPRLTEVGAWRRQSPIGDRRHGLFDGRPHGGYYTQDDIHEIVAYAAARHVTVVPEIDVPGHAGAAIAAYPHLGNTDAPGFPDDDPQVATQWGILDNVLNAEESTLAFLRDVFDEVMDLFPARHIGVGGDECPTGPWEASPRACARIAELGLPNADAIRHWYVARLAEHLAKRGRILYGWDEIVDGGELPPAAVIASWRGIAGGINAARSGHDVVMCPDDQVYLDYRQSADPGEPTPIGTVSSLAHVHAFEPVPSELTAAEAERVLGAQANIWTEHMDSARAVDYMAFPRLAAFAETVWTSRGARGDFAEFERRIAVHERRLDALGVEYRRRTGPLPWQSRPEAPGWPR